MSSPPFSDTPFLAAFECPIPVCPERASIDCNLHDCFHIFEACLICTTCFATSKPACASCYSFDLAPRKSTNRGITIACTKHSCLWKFEVRDCGFCGGEIKLGTGITGSVCGVAYCPNVSCGDHNGLFVAPMSMKELADEIARHPKQHIQKTFQMAMGVRTQGKEVRAAIDEGIRDGLEEEIRTRIENEAQVKVEKEMKMNIALDLEEREAESMAMFDKKTDALKNLNSPRKSVKRRRSQLQPYVMDEGEDYEPGSPFKLKRV